MDTPPPVTPMSNYPRPNLADDRQVLREVAVGQKQVLYCVLGQIVVGVLNAATRTEQPSALPFVVLFLIVGVLIYMIMSVSKLAKALGESPVLYIVLMFVPCVSLIMLLVLSDKATKRLKAAGIKVGLMGADPKSI